MVSFSCSATQLGAVPEGAPSHCGTETLPASGRVTFVSLLLTGFFLVTGEE
jgi:hypothetical protein